MAISWDSFDKIWASTSPLTPYSFSDPNYAQGWNFIGSTPPARQMWDSIQKQNDEKFKYLRDNFGTPNIVTQSSQMTDTDKIYVYLGSEAGWNNGHWYYYDEGTSSWADGGVYNSVAFVTDTTLSIAGQPADAKATGDALALKSDLAGSTFTGNVGINADLSVTGDATIGTDLSVTGSSTLTGNVSANGDVTVTGDVSSANLTTSADATIGGDLSVTGASTLAGNITTSGDISADNISATTNGTIGGNLSVTGTSTLTGNINAGADITVVGDVSADNLTTTTNATVGGSLSVAGTSTLTGNVTTNGNISAVGDISSANLTTTNATIGGNATVTGDVSCANLTTSADASVGGDLTVTGDSTLADTTVNNLVVNNDLSVAGDSSLTNLSVSGTTALAGTSTAPTPSADDNSTKIATTEYVQTEIKPIEVNADIVNKRVTNIEKLLQGNLYDYQTDTDSKYTKTVLAGAMPYASLDSIGGETVVWNQVLNPAKLTSRGTVASVGLTLNKTSDGNGIIVNGTSLSANNLWFANDVTLTNGHKYILACDKYPSNCYISFNNSNVLNTENGAYLFTLTNASSYTQLQFVFDEGVTFTDLTMYPMIFDLTLMYGAGNEPSTVAEFESMFPASYYPYNAGTLLSAGVTEVKSVGKNVFDLQNMATLYSGYITMTDDGFTMTSGIHVFGKKIYENTYKKAGSMAISYKVKYDSTAQGIRLYINYTDGTVDAINNSNAQNVWESKTYITNGNKVVNFVGLNYGSSGVVSNFKDIQFEFGTTATTYSHYTVIDYPIPAEVQALTGYGWSAGNVSNYIDFERKVFVKRVERVDLGTQTWGYSSQYGVFSANFGNADSQKNMTDNPSGIACPRYVFKGVYNLLTDMSCGYIYYKNMAVKDDSFNGDAAAFKTAISGVYAYYPLATPVETDISEYLTDDNLIEVGVGGTLTFPNSNGANYHIPVPSDVTYMIDLQSAIGE